MLSHFCRITEQHGEVHNSTHSTIDSTEKHLTSVKAFTFAAGDYIQSIRIYRGKVGVHEVIVGIDLQQFGQKYQLIGQTSTDDVYVSLQGKLLYIRGKMGHLLDSLTFVIDTCMPEISDVGV